MAIPLSQKDPVLEAQKELLTHAYGNSMAYMNVVFGIGYAGFFATWGFTKDALTYETMLWSALLICASLLSFILFEVYKSFHMSQSLVGMAKAVAYPVHFQQIILSWKAETQARELRFLRIWRVVFVFTLTTGVAAGLTLMSAFVHGLFINR